MKPFYNLAGALAVLLGILGIFLPLLPTTPFLLLASWCFARGSDRLHRWLLSHRVFGEYLRNFEAGRGIPLKAKIVATVMLWGSLLMAMRRFDGITVPALLALTGTCVSLYLWRFLPTLRLDHPAKN
ncbi:YbaN family protein [Massilia sp. LjRoot122]|uniref:YbaN family protein n=1 Tax=Massilia sp. LjRoot122 TaxID=3342257 RepID=UPI003ECDA971